MSIFRLRTLSGANVAGLLLGGSFYAFIFVGSLYMQQVLHYSALQTGVAWLAASLTSIALAGLSQSLVTRGGAKIVMAVGMTLIRSSAARRHFRGCWFAFCLQIAGSCRSWRPNVVGTRLR